MELANISDTARWVAMYRVMESEKRDAIFRDPYARRLAGTRGEDILAAMPKGRTFAWPMIVRTALFDEIIMRVVGGVDTVLNLAAGLDARPYRLALPPSLKWIDVDLPAMIEHKRGVLASEKPRCDVEYVALDLSDRAARRALFARVGASSQRVLVATEGLLVYLTREQAGELASDLHEQPSFRFWLIDIVAPFVLALMGREARRRRGVAALRAGGRAAVLRAVRMAHRRDAQHVPGGEAVEAAAGADEVLESDVVHHAEKSARAATEGTERRGVVGANMIVILSAAKDLRLRRGRSFAVFAAQDDGALKERT